MLKNFPEWIAKGTFSQPIASKKQKAEIFCRISVTEALINTCECDDNCISTLMQRAIKEADDTEVFFLTT